MLGQEQTASSEGKDILFERFCLQIGLEIVQDFVDVWRAGHLDDLRQSVESVARTAKPKQLANCFFCTVSQSSTSIFLSEVGMSSFIGWGIALGF